MNKLLFAKPEKIVKVKKGLKPGRKPLLPRSKNPRKTAHDRAWKAISLYVRFSNADYRGLARCFTCDVVLPYKEADCGHYLHGDNMDFYEDNLHPQCTHCNKYLSGNGAIYGARMVKLYGQEIVDELIRLKGQPRSYGIAELLELEAKYKAKLRDFKMESHLVMEDSA
jgi:hypothetical protein